MEPIKQAIRNRDFDLFKKLVKNFDVSQQNNELVQYACLFGFTEAVEMLLTSESVDPSANGNHCIRFASSLGYVDIVRMLLKDPRVDPCVNNNEPLEQAGMRWRVSVIKLLLTEPSGRVRSSWKRNYVIRSFFSLNSDEFIEFM
jgi:ankyrin repeat protein